MQLNSLLIVPAVTPSERRAWPILRQRIVVNAIQSQIADMRHDAFEGIDIALKAFLVLIVVEVLYSRLLKRPCRSNAIHHRVANLIDTVR